MPTLLSSLHIDQTNESGEVPALTADIKTLYADLVNFKLRDRITLAATDADTPVLFTAPCYVLFRSVAGQFRLRLASGGTLLGPLNLFVVGAKNSTLSVTPTTSFLLSGDGSNQAIVEIWIVEKVS